MGALRFSCNKDVPGVQIPVMHARLRQAGDQDSGASEGLSACVSGGPSIRGVVVPEQYISEGPSVGHELGDQVGPVEDAPGIYRCSHDSGCGEAQLLDLGAVLQFVEAPRPSRPEEAVTEGSHEPATVIPSNHPRWPEAFRIRQDRDWPPPVERPASRISCGSVERSVRYDRLATPRYRFGPCKNLCPSYRDPLKPFRHYWCPTPYHSRAQPTRSKTSLTAILGIRPGRGP